MWKFSFSLFNVVLAAFQQYFVWILLLQDLVMEEIVKNTDSVIKIVLDFDQKLRDRYKVIFLTLNFITTSVAAGIWLFQNVSARIQSLMNQKNDEPLTPIQNKKRAVQLSPVRDGEEAEEDEDAVPLAMLRPVRTARVKAVNSLVSNLRI